MSEIMRVIPFDKLIKRALNDKKKLGTIYGVKDIYIHKDDKTLTIFKEQLETPIGPAAGPHTQLAQNIIAAYAGGSRFFELKTVQELDGEDLHVEKPCIRAEDECYNVEWSTELYVEQAQDEYIKAWYAIKLLAKEFGLGDPDKFIFNMSAGYNLEGIKSKKIDSFINNLKDAKNTEIYKACQKFALENLDLFENVDADFVNSIGSNVCNSITLSTMHGCPANEIENIITHLIKEKKINTYLKCNPTLLSYNDVRNILDSMGYEYISFGKHHFENDLQYKDAIKLIKKLMEMAAEEGLEFGVKLSNTFPVEIKSSELPGQEMYMSGKSLYPLTIQVAKLLSEAFEGKLPISYSGGADDKNIREIFETGIWPITICTILLKPTGYNRIKPLTEKLVSAEYQKTQKVDVEKLRELAAFSLSDKNYIKTEAMKKKQENLLAFESKTGTKVNCNVVCSSCVNVCPNRANVAVELDGQKVLVHIEDYCNECGNCFVFCPEKSMPYKDKLTLFANRADFENSTNQGFFVDENGNKEFRTDSIEFANKVIEALASQYKDIF